MKGDPHPATLAIMAKCRVHTHTQASAPVVGGLHANHTRACIIEGVRYESLTEASIAHRVDRDTVRRWLVKGKGRYA